MVTRGVERFSVKRDKVGGKKWSFSRADLTKTGETKQKRNRNEQLFVGQFEDFA